MRPTSSLPAVDPNSAVVQVFGGRPFHTDGDVAALGFAPDGSLWSVEEPRVLRRWDAATGRPAAWRLLDEPATVWAFGPDASLLAGGSDDLTLWDVATGEVRAAVPQQSWVTALAFRGDGGV